MRTAECVTPKHIGKAEPVMATVESIDAEGKKRTYQVDRTRFDLTPQGIIAHLGLRQPLYEATAQWGHFGAGFRWDKVVEGDVELKD